MQSPSPIVEIRSVSKSYRRGSHVVPVLSDITFDIARGSSSPSWGLQGPARAPC